MKSKFQRNILGSGLDERIKFGKSNGSQITIDNPWINLRKPENSVDEEKILSLYKWDKAEKFFRVMNEGIGSRPLKNSNNFRHNISYSRDQGSPSFL